MHDRLLWNRATEHLPGAREALHTYLEGHPTRGTKGAIERQLFARPCERARHAYAMAIAVKAAQKGSGLPHLGQAWAALVLGKRIPEESIHLVNRAAQTHGSDVQTLSREAKIDLADVLILDARWGPFPCDLEHLAERHAHASRRST